MPESTRRKFLVTAALGAAAVGVAATGPAFATSGSTSGSAEPEQPAAEGALIAYISDPSSGEITVFTGGKTITMTDRSIAAKLSHTAG